jgi:CheY-like chemotaxis protein
MSRAPATIVVLEENAAAQELIDQLLRQEGDRVLITNNPMEILGLAKRVRIDLVVGDVDRIGVAEPQLAARIRSLARVLQVSSGASVKLDTAGPTRLDSPFALGDLKNAVAHALACVDALE